jgi:hypothetical protein
MSGSYPNPFFTDPNIARGFGILARTFLPDPEGEAGRQARLGQARHSNVQADEIENRMRRNAAAGENLRPGRGGSMADTVLNTLAELAAGGDARNLAAVRESLPLVAQARGALPLEIARMLVANGGNFAHTEPGFERTDQTQRRGQDVSAGATLGAARIGADGAMARERLQEEGRNRRYTVTARPGDTITAPENSPVAPAGQQGPLTLRGDPRPLTRDAAIASLVPEFLNPPADEDPGVAQRRRELVAPGAAVADIRNQGRPPPNVPASILQRVGESIAAPMTFRDGTERTLDAESQRWMRERTTELWQNGPEGVRGNPEVALREAWLEYENAGPPLTGTRLTGRGAQLPPSLRRGAAPPAAPAGAPAPAPAPAQGGYRNPVSGQTIPEGATIRQNGRNYIIRNGQPVPAS